MISKIFFLRRTLLYTITAVFVIILAGVITTFHVLLMLHFKAANPTAPSRERRQRNGEREIARYGVEGAADVVLRGQFRPG